MPVAETVSLASEEISEQASEMPFDEIARIAAAPDDKRASLNSASEAESTIIHHSGFGDTHLSLKDSEAAESTITRRSGFIPDEMN